MALPFGNFFENCSRENAINGRCRVGEPRLPTLSKVIRVHLRSLEEPLGERKLRAMEHIPIGRSIVSEHRSTMHCEAEPRLEISSQAWLSEQKSLSEALFAAPGGRPCCASGADILWRIAVTSFSCQDCPLKHRSVFACVVETSEECGSHDQVRMLSESDPEFVIASHRPLSRKCRPPSRRDFVAKTGLLHDAAEPARIERSRTNDVTRKGNDTGDPLYRSIAQFATNTHQPLNLGKIRKDSRHDAHRPREIDIIAIQPAQDHPRLPSKILWRSLRIGRCPSRKRTV